MASPQHIVAHLNYLDTEVFTARRDKSIIQYKPGEYYECEPLEENDKLISELTGAKATRKVIIRDGRYITAVIKTDPSELPITQDPLAVCDPRTVLEHL